MNNHRKNIVLILVLIGLFIVTFSTIFNSKLDINGDNFGYLTLARAIATGLGYVDMGNMNLPAVNHFPPGYPAFLALFMTIGIKSIIFFKILNGLFLLGSVLLLFKLLEKWIQNTALALSVVILSLMSVHLLQFATMVMTEVPYLFFSVLAVWLLDKISERSIRPWKDFYFYLLFITISVMYYFRSVGVCMLGAVIVFYSFRKEWLSAVSLLIGFVITVVPWSIRDHLAGLHSRYLGTIMTVNPWRPEEGNIASVGEFLEKMIKNLDDTVIKGFREVLFPFIPLKYGESSGSFGWVLGFVVLIVILWGFWQITRYRWLLISYLLFNIGIFMLWHGGNGVRYVIPIIPFVFAGFYVGIYGILRLFIKGPVVLQRFPYIFILLVIFMTPPLRTQGKYAKEPYMPAYQNYFQVAKAIEKQAPRKSVICCRKPELLLYYTPSMYTSRYTYSLDDKVVIRDMVATKTDFVILEQLGYGSTGRYLLPAINKNPELFTLVLHLKDPDTYLFRFERDKAGALMLESKVD